MSKNAIIIGVGFSDNVSKQLDNMANRLRAKARTLASVGQEMTMGLTLPIIAAGGATLKFAGDLDALKRALAANMGSASAAAKEFENLRKAAEAPGIGLEEAVRGSMLLQGLGDTADEARRQMLAFAKAVALSGGGSENFGGLMHQFTQMRGVGKILGQDVRIMIENAPVLGRVLNEAFGTASPEKLREMGISVETFVTKVVAQLETMEGVGGSLKNDLENLWTSLRVGIGEMGLAAIGATDMQDGIAKLSEKVTEITGEITKWIKAHPELTRNLITTLGAIGATGPFVRFVGDIGLATSAVISFGGALSSIPGKLIAIDKAAKTVSLTATGWAGVIVGTVMALHGLADRLDKYLNEEDGKRKVYTDAGGRKYTKTLGSEIALGTEGRQYLADPISNEARASGKAIFDSFLGAAQASLGWVDPNAPKTDNKKPPPTPTPGDKNKFKWSGDPVNTGMPWWNPASTPDDKPSIDKIMEGFSVADYSKQVPLLGITRESLEDLVAAKAITDEYKKSIDAVNIQYTMSLDKVEQMKGKVNALASQYSSLAEVYGVNSERAISALEAWKTAQDELNKSIKEQADAEERKNKALEYGKAVFDGISETFADAISGAKGFASAILKAVGAVAKLAIVEYVQKTISQLGFFGAIPAIAGGALLAGAIDGLLGKVSFAEGAVLKGETIMRGGEYPNAHINPEVVSPVNIMQKYIRQAVSEAGGGQTSIGLGVHGDYLVPLISRAQDRHMRRGSGNIIF